jgi:hypothetical protein
VGLDYVELPGIGRRGACHQAKVLSIRSDIRQKLAMNVM